MKKLILVVLCGVAAITNAQIEDRFQALQKLLTGDFPQLIAQVDQAGTKNPGLKSLMQEYKMGLNNMIARLQAAVNAKNIQQFFDATNIAQGSLASIVTNIQDLMNKSTEQASIAELLSIRKKSNRLIQEIEKIRAINNYENKLPNEPLMAAQKVMDLLTDLKKTADQISRQLPNTETVGSYSLMLNKSIEQLKIILDNKKAEQFKSFMLSITNDENLYNSLVNGLLKDYDRLTDGVTKISPEILEKENNLVQLIKGVYSLTFSAQQINETNR